MAKVLDPRVYRLILGVLYTAPFNYAIELHCFHTLLGYEATTTTYKYEGYEEIGT